MTEVTDKSGAKIIKVVAGYKDKPDNGGKILNAMLAVDGTSGKYPDFRGKVATVRIDR